MLHTAQGTSTSGFRSSHVELLGGTPEGVVATSRFHVFTTNGWTVDRVG